MSNSAAENAELIELISSGIIDNRLGMGVITLLVYEYLLTFNQEVSLFWRRKKTGAAWLFFPIRYMALLNFAFFGGAVYSPMSDHSCKLIQKAQFPVLIIQYLFWAAFSGLRTLALSDMNRSLASIVVVLSSGQFAVNLWVYIGLDVGGENIPLVGCTGTDDPTLRQAIIGTAVSRSTAILADVIVLWVTIYYAMNRGDGAFRGAGRTTLSLSEVLTVYGALYFLALVVMNVLQIIFTLLSVTDVQESVGYVTIFTDPITSVLICRFLIALQSANQRTVVLDVSDIHLSGDETRTLGTLQFASSFIGSMGGPLVSMDPGTSLLDDDDDAQHDRGLVPRVEETQSVVEDSGDIRKGWGSAI